MPNLSAVRLPRLISARKALTETTPRRTISLASARVIGSVSRRSTLLITASIGEGTKVPHLSYIGDAEIGEETNIGAGTITANFPHRPGMPKGKTTIGDNVRVAVDTMFVAPVTVGDDAWTAAGSVITDDVPDNTLAGFPPRQVNKEGRGGKRDD